MPTRIAVISDTHLPRGRRRLPDPCLAELRAADLVLHGGDIATAAVLDELEAVGPPVLAVLGNVDEPALAARVPAERVVEVEGVRIAMVHDAGPAPGRLARLRRRFPGAQAVVFGHSHIPLHETDGAVQIFNPGSPLPLAVGQPVTVIATLNERIKGIVLPAQAVVRSPANEAVVWVKASAERYVPQPVVTRALDAQTVVVTRGLAPDNRVVVQGAPLIAQIR